VVPLLCDRPVQREKSGRLEENMVGGRGGYEAVDKVVGLNIVY